MFEEICGYLNNYFQVKPNGIHCGKFTIENGSINCDFLQTGQYFRIVNSVFNDGIYIYPANGLIDEIFIGEVWAMKVPPAFIAIVAEIEEWQSNYGSANSVAMSPFASESFNNYSYTKAGSGNRVNAGGGTGPSTWSDVYGPRLVRWKKI